MSPAGAKPRGCLPWSLALMIVCVHAPEQGQCKHCSINSWSDPLSTTCGFNDLAIFVVIFLDVQHVSRKPCKRLQSRLIKYSFFCYLSISRIHKAEKKDSEIRRSFAWAPIKGNPPACRLVANAEEGLERMTQPPVPWAGQPAEPADHHQLCCHIKDAPSLACVFNAPLIFARDTLLSRVQMVMDEHVSLSSKTE